MILFETENIELEYHPQFNVIELRWIGMLDLNKWKRLIPHLIKAADSYEVESILLDASYVDVEKSTPAFHQVQVEQYFNGLRLIPNLKKIARVVSGIIAYDESIQEQYASLVEPFANLKFKNFQHHYQAMYWITGTSSLQPPNLTN